MPHLIKDSLGDIATAQRVVAQGQQLGRVAGREVHAVDLEAVGDEDVGSFLSPAALQNHRSHRHRSLELFLLMTIALKARSLVFKCFLDSETSSGPSLWKAATSCWNSCCCSHQAYFTWLISPTAGFCSHIKIWTLWLTESSGWISDPNCMKAGSPVPSLLNFAAFCCFKRN